MTDDSARDVTARYDRQAPAYRDWMAPVLHAPGRRLVSELAQLPARTILDVGAGVGTLLPRLRAAFPGASVLACDRARGMLALAPPETPRVVMDAGRLGVASESVDLVLCVFMLFFLEDPCAGLREARRVLRPGGRVGTVTWGGELESEALSIWTSCLQEHETDEPDPLPAERDELLDTPQKMELVMRAAGLGSARSWTEELVTTIDLEHVIHMKTSVGRQKARFEQLGPEAGRRCVAAARRRMAALGPEGFVARAPIVYAVARRD